MSLFAAYSEYESGKMVIGIRINTKGRKRGVVCLKQNGRWEGLGVWRDVEFILGSGNYGVQDCDV